MYIEFDLPEIPEHANGFSQYWLKTLFIESPSNRYQINALTSTYVRLVEAALVEYQSGAVTLREFYGTHSSINLGALYKSMSHFETCISNVYRATKCFQRLRRDPEQCSLSRVLKVKNVNFASGRVADRFRIIRNEIHHIEGKIMNKLITDGQPFVLKPDGPEIQHPTESNQTIKTIDRLVIGSLEIKFSEITTSLRELAVVAEKIAEF